MGKMRPSVDFYVKEKTMTGLVIAGIALVLLIAFLKLNTSLSEEEKEELEAEKILENSKKDKKKTNNSIEQLLEEEEEQRRRSIRLDRATEILVQVMEDGSVAEIQQAINNGIDILQKLPGNQNLLMIAVKNNPSTEVIQFLLDQGIEVNDVDDNGQTALILASAFNSNPEVVKVLLDNGADKTIRDKSRKTAADYVVLNTSYYGTDIPALLKDIPNG